MRRVGPRLPLFIASLLTAIVGPVRAQEPPGLLSAEETAIYMAVLRRICQADPERSAPILLSPERQTGAEHSWQVGRGDLVTDSLRASTADSLVAATCLEAVDRGEPWAWPRYATVRLSPPRVVDDAIEVRVVWKGRHPSAGPRGGTSIWLKSTIHRVARTAETWTVVQERLDWIT